MRLSTESPCADPIAIRRARERAGRGKQARQYEGRIQRKGEEEGATLNKNPFHIGGRAGKSAPTVWKDRWGAGGSLPVWNSAANWGAKYGERNQQKCRLSRLSISAHSARSAARRRPGAQNSNDGSHTFMHSCMNSTWAASSTNVLPHLMTTARRSEVIIMDAVLHVRGCCTKTKRMGK